MSRSKPNRRWLQFSLRGVLVLTLAVALWLGYEVRQARHVEQTVAAIQELGGNAECELTGWSLLRLCRVPGYGRRIVRAEIPGSAVEEAIGLLRDSPGLREVQVTYDGTFDPAPSWKALLGALPTLEIQPHVKEEIVDEYEDGHQCFSRLSTKVEKAYPSVVDPVAKRQGLRSYLTGAWRRVLYRVVRLPDDSLAETLSGMVWWSPEPADEGFFTLLVVNDTCVSIRGFSTFGTSGGEVEITFEDLDGDRMPDIGFQWTSTTIRDSRIRQLGTDPRDWLGVYKIERSGFTSLLSEDNSLFTNADGEAALPPVRPPRATTSAP